jgi:NADH-quinone oxidoreductase subunit I
MNAITSALRTVIFNIEQLGRGLSVTWVHMWRKPTTQMYPEVKPKLPPRFRARHQLQRYPDGLEKCIGCSLCAAACPSDAILVIAAENTPEHRVSPGERYAAVYEINMIRCIFCGFCEEACPTGAIVLKRNFELAAVDRQHYVFDKQMLLNSPNE